MERTSDEILASLPRRLIDALATRVAEAPAAPAIWQGARCWSYAQLAAGIEAARVRLAAAGVRPGDRVALVIENSVAAVAYVYAVTALDAWAVMINARFTAREIGIIRTSAGARLAVYSTGDSDAAARHADEAGAVSEESEHFGAVAIGPADPSAVPEPIVESAEQIGAMIFTSGTTGRPKGAMLSHRALLYQSAIVAERRAFGPGDCAYVVAPMVHVLGLAGMVLPLLYAGAAMELAARFDPETVLAELREGRLTHLYGAAPMIAALVGRAGAGTITAPRLKEVLAGGAPIDPALRDTAARVFGMALGTGYAATEFTPISASTPANPSNPGAVGRPWHGMDFRLVDEAGDEVPQGEVGEVWCRGPNAMSGYYRDPDATAAIMRPGGWIAIGDLARLDEDGQIHLVGRLKDLIIRSGFNVYPAEVEGVLTGHSDVLIAAVVGRPVEGNEEVIAFVEPIPDHTLDTDDLATFAAERLAPYKKPARIVVLECVPVGPTGKIDKVALRERAAALD
ncbi:MAG: class I adenylate-forming enzyme family protein [Alphaproteobacteria bacterium]